MSDQTDEISEMNRLLDLSIQQAAEIERLTQALLDERDAHAAFASGALSSIKRLTQERDAAEARFQSAWDTAVQFKVKMEALRAELDALKRQEPGATVKEDYQLSGTPYRHAIVDLPVGAKVYASPIPAQQESSK